MATRCCCLARQMRLILASLYLLRPSPTFSEAVRSSRSSLLLRNPSNVHRRFHDVFNRLHNAPQIEIWNPIGRGFFRTYARQLRWSSTFEISLLSFSSHPSSLRRRISPSFGRSKEIWISSQEGTFTRAARPHDADHIASLARAENALEHLSASLSVPKRLCNIVWRRVFDRGGFARLPLQILWRIIPLILPGSGLNGSEPGPCHQSWGCLYSTENARPVIGYTRPRLQAVMSGLFDRAVVTVAQRFWGPAASLPRDLGYWFALIGRD